MKSLPGRLLIVDDNELNRDMLARRLERKGYSVEVAESAQQLPERIQQVGTWDNIHSRRSNRPRRFL